MLDLFKLLAPFAPHLCEQMNELFGGTKSIFLSGYPATDESKLTRDEVEYAVQVNSKLKSRVVAPAAATQKELEALALSDPKIAEALNGATPKKVIVIPKRLVNIIV
jgi:leucyl-tRNA synthetase